LNSGVLVVGQSLRSNFTANQVLRNLDLLKSSYPTQAFLAMVLHSRRAEMRVFVLPDIYNYMFAERYTGHKHETHNFTMKDFSGICAQSIVHITGIFSRRSVVVSDIVKACA